MLLAPCLCALFALLLVLAAQWYAWDGRRLEAPQAGAYAPAEVWAHDLEASLESSEEHATAVLVHHGVMACPWTLPAALLARLGMTLADIPMRTQRSAFLG